MRISDWSSDVCSSDLQVHLEESGLSAAEMLSNESQGRYVLAILPEDVPRFDAIERRERCPYAVVGVATEERQLRVTYGEGLPGIADAAPEESRAQPRPVDVPINVILGKPPRMTRDVERLEASNPALDLVGIALDDAIERVLRHPTVASKNFLITIGDRTVGSLTRREQMVEHGRSNV